ncbi:thiamine phosphate synthase [Paenibacillus albidus]|uniref:thiamine phosphate synthase n=1 Tax=Paenibacillus albidus TaxID=2041023 RepID=UPI001BEAAB94|nr:thiamine phosphate synthase [Paenibacillus albidus]MBT2292209.1 thiamine phosphate synthase [Paenibacillus albidus]
MAKGEIHLIMGGKLSLLQFARLAANVHEWVDYIHLREKSATARELLAAAKDMLSSGIPAAQLVINDRIDVALASEASGVQLGWHSLDPAVARLLAPGLRLGRSVHSAAEAEEAAMQGADYCLYGHVYPSASKPGQPAHGLALLAETVRRCPLPVIAIGGIGPGNAGEVMQQGAAGIAVMSGICGAGDPCSAARAIRLAVQGAPGRDLGAKEVTFDEIAD